MIAAGARVKQRGATMRGEAVELVMRHQVQHDILPYERLFDNAIRGDNALFTNDECVEAAWAVVEPALLDDMPVQEYEPGSWVRRLRPAS